MMSRKTNYHSHVESPLSSEMRTKCRTTVVSLTREFLVVAKIRLRTALRSVPEQGHMQALFYPSIVTSA